jgi:ABC-type antimicrobial peptide transport system permease subunit
MLFARCGLIRALDARGLLEYIICNERWMLTLMNTRRSSSIGCAGVLGIAIFSMIGGVILGGVYGSHQINSIAEEIARTDPNNPLDMLPYIFVFDIIIGALIGMVIGTISGIILNFKLKGLAKVQESSTKI